MLLLDFGLKALQIRTKPDNLQINYEYYLSETETLNPKYLVYWLDVVIGTGTDPVLKL
jgi:hypothetical protein